MHLGDPGSAHVLGANLPGANLGEEDLTGANRIAGFVLWILGRVAGYGPRMKAHSSSTRPRVARRS